MSLTVKRDKVSFERIPADIHNAICIQIIELGTQEVQFKGETLQQQKVNITWELCEELMEDGRPFVISKEYTLSLNEKARLCKDLTGWRGRSFTDDELKGFELKNILGKACRLTIIDYTNPKTNKTYSTVEAIATKSKLFDIEKPYNPIVLLDFDDFDFDVFNSLSKYLQEKIQKSPEYKSLNMDKQYAESLDIDPNCGEVVSEENSEEIPF